MNFKNIQMEDKKLFSDFQYICSDYIFSYLYMYSELYKLTIHHDDRCVIIRSEDKDPYFYMPLGDIKHGIEKVTKYCSNNNIKTKFSKIPCSHAEIFRNNGFILEEDRNSYDYIYINSQLAEYNGKEFRKQRNNMSSYFRMCTPVYTEDIYNHIEKCREFTLKYFKKFDIINPTLRMLEKMEDFDCKGSIVWDGQNIQAFCVYEKVKDDMIQSHVELTDNSHRGIHAFLINEMSKRVSERYVNKEDDVGLLGLRRFKESYNPIHMLRKYTAHLE